MKNTHYLFRIAQTYACKNKLESDILKYISSLDRTLIEAYRINKFQSHVKECIDLINQEHFRCKAIECEWYASSRVKGANNIQLRFKGTNICAAYLNVAIYEPISISF